MYHLGIDISKKSFAVSVLDEEGEAITKVLSFPCTHKRFEKLVDKISSLKLKKSEVLIGIEATGNLWENLYSFLEGYRVIILNPYQTRNNDLPPLILPLVKLESTE